ncbi:hypothetical protein EI74_0250 [Mycoplasma testudineum]|uniref:Uncharacterized protein n=2 Tax=Mycoplasma testudineum TaxID=244584 RepID=A0A4R6IH35_9MOLU|nr:hypothetical protein EI74_0250 [Mycoplasma testudineum]
MSIPTVKSKLLGGVYDSIKIRVYVLTLSLNGTTLDVIVGGLHSNGGNGWDLDKPRSKQVAEGIK